LFSLHCSLSIPFKHYCIGLEVILTPKGVIRCWASLNESASARPGKPRPAEGTRCNPIFRLYKNLTHIVGLERNYIKNPNAKSCIERIENRRLCNNTIIQHPTLHNNEKVRYNECSSPRRMIGWEGRISLARTPSPDFRGGGKRNSEENGSEISLE